MAANTKAPTQGTLMAFPAILTLDEFEALVVDNFGALQAFACLAFTGTTWDAIISSGVKNRRSTFRVYLLTDFFVVFLLSCFMGIYVEAFSAFSFFTTTSLAPKTPRVRGQCHKWSIHWVDTAPSGAHTLRQVGHLPVLVEGIVICKVASLNARAGGYKEFYHRYGNDQPQFLVFGCRSIHLKNNNSLYHPRHFRWSQQPEDTAILLRVEILG